MAYKKFQADQLFTGYDMLSNEHVLITDDAGQIENIVLQSDAGEDVQKLQGILSPGFVNCHCHLELSHMKGKIPPGTGLIDFLCTVVTRREAAADGSEDPTRLKMKAIADAEKEMQSNGIVAVGDIGNTADTAIVKTESRIFWQNFVEVLGFTDEKAQANLAHYEAVLSSLEQTLLASPTPHRSSLVPHAPYSISARTFQLINELTKGQVISIHNQEHPAEDELYKTGGGGFLQLFRIFGINQSPFPVTGKTSLRSYLPRFNNGQTIFLVHNTYMPEEDILFANEYAAQNSLKLVYCLCPNANLYIENKLPPFDLFVKHGCHLVLGTDSYSSNWQLSIAKEIQAVVSNRPAGDNPAILQALQWATLNGAQALQWDDRLGSFENGKTPGVVLLDDRNWTSERLI